MTEMVEPKRKRVSFADSPVRYDGAMDWGEEGDKNGINGMELRIATDGTGD